MTENYDDNQSEDISGTIESIIFHKQDNGFIICKFKDSSDNQNKIITGNFDKPHIKASFIATGKWTNNNKYGRQFKTKTISIEPPITIEGITEYLSSKEFPGIGKTTAKKIASFLGPTAIEIIINNPERLNDIPRLSENNKKTIKDKLKENHSLTKLTVFLNSHGITSSYTKRIIEKYGEKAVENITQNPYLLAQEIKGIGFQKADEIAKHFSIEKNNPFRISAGISYLMDQYVSNGHCGYPIKEFLFNASDKLDVYEDKIKEELFNNIMEQENPEYVIHSINGQECIFPKKLAEAENSIKKEIKRLSLRSPPWNISKYDNAITWAQNLAGFVFAEKQKEAIKLALQSKILILTGPPGTGKTTIIKAIISILKIKGLSVTLCGPTGLSAKKMREATNNEASTIHSLLGIGNEKSKTDLSTDMLIIDEASMVDVLLMQKILKSIPNKTAVLFVGDIDQIPPVGPGQPFRDMITSHTIPVVKLDVIQRQGKGSQIVENAHLINQGKMPNLNNSQMGETDFYFLESEDPDKTIEKIKNLVKTHIPKNFGFNPLKDIQILSPMKSGVVGTNNINLTMRELLNPDASIRSKKGFYVGDKVMQTKNNQEKGIINGDVGIIKSIGADEKLTIDFDGTIVELEKEESNNIVHAYAITIHKSQGSEYPCVIIVLLTQHYMMLQRNLLYTGVTRSRKLTIVLGQKKAINIAIQNDSSVKRWTRLHEILENK